MSTKVQRREAARRRISVSSLAPEQEAPSLRSYTTLGGAYSTLSVKVPKDMATALAGYAASRGVSVSEAVRSCIAKTLSAEQEVHDE